MIKETMTLAETVRFAPRARLIGLALALATLPSAASATSILAGNFLPNPNLETETRFVSHRTEGPTDNSFADYWHHSLYSGWNDLTPPGAAEPVVSGLHSLRLFDRDTDPPTQQGAYYFAPLEFGAGTYTQEEFRTFATAIPTDAASPTGRAQQLWFRWHWNYSMTAPEGGDPSVTLNIRTSNDPVISLDLSNSNGDNKTIRTGSSLGQWEEVTYLLDLAALGLTDAKSFDMIFLTEGSKDALGIMYVDDVSVSALNPNANANFNGINGVDGADLLTWQRGLGLAGQINNSQGDADGNGSVNGADLTVWKGQFGNPQTLAASATAPEPASGALLLLAVAWACGMLRCGWFHRAPMCVALAEVRRPSQPGRTTAVTRSW